MWDAIEQELGSDVWDQWDEYWDLEGAEQRAYWNSHPDIQRYGDIKEFWQGLIAQSLVRIDGRIRDVSPELRNSVGLTAGQQGIAGGIGTERLPAYSWAEWGDILGTSMARLVADYAIYGEQLPDSAMYKLGRAGADLGIDNPFLVLELASQAAVMNYANP